MKMDYRIKKAKKIAYCILDNINNQSSTTSQETARNITDFFLTVAIRRNYDVFIDDTTDKLLQRVAQSGYYTHAVVLITGTHMGLSERLFDAIELKCQEHFTIAGHILDRSKFDGYYEIHDQFFIANMAEYRRLGSPAMGESIWNDEHTKLEPIRSEEIVNNDEEIPVWIKQGQTEKTYKHKRHGWNFIDQGLKQDAIFCDVGDVIRQNKKYIYFEYDHTFYRHMPELFNYSLICNNMVTPWNSDSLPDTLYIDKPVDHYISTGTGLNWIHNLMKLRYHQDTKVTFIDISYAVLSFMKALVEEWDGIDYATFYMKQVKFVPESYDYDLVNHEARIREWWLEFEKTFDNFQETWHTIKKLKYDFKLLDFFVNNNYKFIIPGEVNFINVSDAFNHVPYVPFASVKFRVSRENNLIATLKNIDENILLHIPTRIGHFYKPELSSGEKIIDGLVKDFSLWDINQFTAPPWQAENWKSFCPMTGVIRILQ
jgi:hypothetical protein